MKGQSVIISSYLAIVLVILVLFVTFIHFIPLTNTNVSSKCVYLDLEKIIYSRINWTARDLVEAIVSSYNPDYVNVTIRIYDVLNDNRLIDSDNAVYMPYNIDLNKLVVRRYVFTDLGRGGCYREIIVEVGFK